MPLYTSNALYPVERTYFTTSPILSHLLKKKNLLLTPKNVCISSSLSLLFAFYHLCWYVDQQNNAFHFSPHSFIIIWVSWLSLAFTQLAPWYSQRRVMSLGCLALALFPLLQTSWDFCDYGSQKREYIYCEYSLPQEKTRVISSAIFFPGKLTLNRSVNTTEI